jgi:hypothetical protein
MYPGIVFAVLTTDPDFAIDITTLLRSQHAEVFVASSFEEYEALQAEGVVVEMMVIDPVFRLI